MSLSRRKLITISTGALVLAAGTALLNHAAMAQGGILPEAIKGLLDPAMAATVLRQETVGASTYFVVAQLDDEGSGELVVIRMPANGEPVIIEDVRGLPAILLNPPDVADDSDISLAGFTLPAGDLTVVPTDVTEAASDELDAKVFAAAKANLGMDTSQAPGTNHGRLACAWSVNKIVTLALGAPIGGGLATANMITVLKSRHTKVSEARVTPGTIVISPTEYHGGRSNVGHVGIVGENRQIYSNSSNHAQWQQNFTIEKWKNYYGGKGLTVQFFRLNEAYF